MTFILLWRAPKFVFWLLHEYSCAHSQIYTYTDVPAHTWIHTDRHTHLQRTKLSDNIGGDWRNVYKLLYVYLTFIMTVKSRHTANFLFANLVCIILWYIFCLKGLTKKEVRPNVHIYFIKVLLGWHCRIKRLAEAANIDSLCILTIN